MRKTIRGKTILALGVALAVTACTETETMPGPQEGRAHFMANCAVCHGDSAKGNGPMAGGLTKAPADLTLIAMRNGGTFPRARVMSTVDGYARSDMAGPGMPEFGELLMGDLVPFNSGDGIQTPTPRKLVALVEYLETIQQTR